MEEALDKFVEETGAERDLARDLLRSNQWKYEGAIKSFQDMTLGSVSSVSESDGSPSKRTVKTRCSSAKLGKLRGISVVNSDIVSEARSKVIKGDILETGERYEHFEAMPNYTFVLPDLSTFPDDFADFLRRDLIETSTLVALEQAGRLNWWADMGVAQRLVPLATSGDGNCLLHAASLGMWGFHDRLLTLRKALFRTLTGGLASGAIKRRWRFQQWEKNMEAGGLLYSEAEWDREWNEILRIASTQRRKPCKTEVPKKSNDQPSFDTIGEAEGEEGFVSTPKEDPEKKELQTEDFHEEQTDRHTENDDEYKGAFESLEEIHVFVLAHVLRRPIIVVSDTMLLDFSGEPIAPIPFGGIYFPLECPPESCFKCPLLLTYDAAHFSALVACEEERLDSKKKKPLLKAIPVVGPSFDLLPIHYAVDPGPEFDWSTLENPSIKSKLELTMQQKLNLLKKYLQIVELKVPCSAKKNEKVEASKSGVKSSTSVEEKNMKESTATGLSTSLESAPEGNGNDLKAAAKKVTEVGTWIGSQLVKVGNLAGVIGSAIHTNVYAAALKTDRKPEYYDKMIENYIASARERFEEEQRERERKKLEGNDERPQPCLTAGCQLYGTSATSYLCSGCYQRQMKEAENYTSTVSTAPTECTLRQIGSSLPYLPCATSPPSYAEACARSSIFAPVTKAAQMKTAGVSKSQPSLTTNSPAPRQSEMSNVANVTKSNIGRTTSEGQESNRSISRCKNSKCEFYGSSQNAGYCSACFRDHQQILLYRAKQEGSNF